MRILQHLTRAGSRILSHFHATTKDGDNPYDKIGAKDLALMTGHSHSFFEALGKSSVSLALLDSTKMESLISDLPAGILTYSVQRALRKNAVQEIGENYATYKKVPVFSVLNKHIFPGLFQEIRRAHQIDI